MATVVWLVRGLLLLAWTETGRASSNNDTQDTQQFELVPPLPITVLGSNNEKCRQDSELLFANLRNSTTWAMQMLESSARSGVGVLKGEVYQLGNYDECVETVKPIRGRYCLTTVSLSRPSSNTENQTWDFDDSTAPVWNKWKDSGNPFRIPRNTVFWALCVPDSCSHEDVQTSLQSYLATHHRNNNNVTISVHVDSALCALNDEPLSYSTLTYSFVLMLVMLVVIISSVIDSFTQENPSSGSAAKEYFLLFSIKRNLSELFKIKSSKRQYMTIHICKIIMLFGVVVSHHIESQQIVPIKNYETIERMKATNEFKFMFQEEILVNALFFCGGYMLALLLVDETSPKIWKTILSRYARLTPMYAMVVFFCCTLMFRSGDGPLWNSMIKSEHDNCNENWWTNLLYINNYVNPERMCMMHSWYMPCDMHFFIIGVIILKILHTSPKTGYIILGCTILLSTVVQCMVGFIYKVDPVLHLNRIFLLAPGANDYFQTMYIKSHTRATPYLVGITVGYLVKTKKLSYKDLKSYTHLSGLIGFIICWVTFYWGLIFKSPDWEYDVIHASLAIGLRSLFISVGWTLMLLSINIHEIHKSSTRNRTVTGGRTIQNYSTIVALSRLTYGIYLVHHVLQRMWFASYRTSQHFTLFSNIFDIIAEYVLSLGIALALHITVEFPIYRLFKKIFLIDEM